jgi:hypothetical protein
MTVTVEPRGLVWINNVSMASFGSLVTNACWFFGSVSLTVVACILLLTPDGPSLVTGTSIPTSHENHRALGFQLAGILLAAWGVKTGAGVVESQNKRKASPDYVPVLEAQAKVEAAKMSVPAPVTGEQPVQPLRSAPPDPNGPAQEWASGEPQEGVL